MRHATIAAIALVALSACSGSADSGSPDPSPSPSSSAPAPTPSDTAPPGPPVMPQTAKAHTKAGAKAFVEYFWQVVTYAQATGDVGAIRELVEDGCEGCRAGIKAIADVYDKGGSIRGGRATVSNIKVTLGFAGHLAVADVVFDVALARQVVSYPSGDHPGKARRSKDRFNLTAESNSDWRVTDFRAVS